MPTVNLHTPSVMHTPMTTLAPEEEAESEGTSIYELLGNSSVIDGLGILFEAGPPVLTNEMIMAMVRRRVGELDRQLIANMEKLESNTRASQSIARRQEALQMIRDRITATKGEGSDEHMTIAELMEEPFLVDGEPMTFGELVDAHDLDQFLDPDQDAHYDPNRQLIVAELDGYIEQVKLQGRRLNSGNETLMLEVQTMMQQRSQVFTMGSNMFSVTDRTMNSIIGRLAG